jgi:hypothetical protein
LLHNGKLLIAGGTRLSISGFTNFAQSTNSVELLDMTLATPALASAASLPSARSGFTATLLPSGKVMVVGGVNITQFSTVWRNDIATYDPVSHSWTAGPEMPNARANHTASLLPTGAVMLTAGAMGTSAVTLATTLVRVSALSSGSALGAACEGYSSATLTPMPNGYLLVAGGGGSSPSGKAFLIDATTQTCVALADLGVARRAHSATLLPSGQVLIAGGSVVGASITSSAELYDPSANANATPPGQSIAQLFMARARTGHTSTLLDDGRVFIVGGLAGVATPINADDPPEIFDPATNTFTTTSFTNVPRRVGHAAVLLPGGDVLLLAGSNSEDCKGAARGWSRYSLASATVTHGSLHIARCRAVATLLPNGKVLLAGGVAAGSNVALTDAEIFDPETNTSMLIGSMTVAHGFARSASLPTGEVFIVSHNLSSSDLYDSVANAWRSGPSLSVPRSEPSIGLSPNGALLVVGAIKGFFSSTSATESILLNLAPVVSQQPALGIVTGSLTPTNALSAFGTGLRPALQASGGDTQQSASNAPVFELQRLDNDQRMFLPQAAVTLLGSSPFTDTSFVSAAAVASGFPRGHARLRAWVNGVPSAERIVLVAVAPYQPSAPTAAAASLSSATVTFSATPFFDGGSALTKYGVETELGAAVGSCNLPCTSITVTGLTPGSTHRFRVFASNAVGEGARSPLSNSITLPKRSSTTSVVSSANPSVYAQSVTFTATVAVAGGAPLAGGGTVSFSANGNPVPGCGAVAVTLVAGSNVASCTSAAFATSATNFTINATFSGDAQTSFSFGQLTQTVNKADQAITNPRFTAVAGIDSVISVAPVGRAILVTADTVSPNLPLSFSLSPASHGVCVLQTLAGFNQLNVFASAFGTCTVLIDQTGDTNYNAAPRVSVSIPVLPVAAVAVTGVPARIAVGQSVRIAVSVTGNAPTGTVSASVGSPLSLETLGCSNVLLSGTGNTRSASCLVQGLMPTAALDYITASYSGDANNFGANAPEVDEPLVYGTPSLNIDLSPAPGTRNDAATDGVMILRHLAGFTGDAITDGAMHPSFGRSPPDVLPYLESIRAALDVNGDGRVDLAVDGLLIVRYMRGQRTATGLFNSIDVGTAMTTAQIEAYLQLLMP